MNQTTKKDVQLFEVTMQVTIRRITEQYNQTRSGFFTNKRKRKTEQLNLSCKCAVVDHPTIKESGQIRMAANQFTVEYLAKRKILTKRHRIKILHTQNITGKKPNTKSAAEEKPTA